MLARQLWTAQRFGLTPRKLAGRAARAGVPRVLVVSLPKAGTHLVERAVCLHPRLYRQFRRTLNPENVGPEGLDGVLRTLRPGQVALAHLPFDPAYASLLEGVRTLFVVRDPRDIAVSLAHYIESRGDHPLHFAYGERPDERSRIELAILGDAEARPPAPSLESLLAGFAGWLESGALVVRFEDLIGARGGGDDDAQARTLREIYDYLGVELAPEVESGSSRARARPSARGKSAAGARRSTRSWRPSSSARPAGGWRSMATSGIVVSHGHARELESSLPALAPQVDELLVVANIPGSLPADLHGARVIENERPRSYSANLNAAFARTSGELVVVCNPDAVAEPKRSRSSPPSPTRIRAAASPARRCSTRTGRGNPRGGASPR